MMQSLFQDERLQAGAGRAGDEPEQLFADARQPALPLPRRGLAHAAEAMQLMDELQEMDRLESRSSRRATRTTSRRSTPSRSRSSWATTRPDDAGAAPADHQAARGGRLPRAQGRPAGADPAGDPQDRPEGAARHLPAPQARPLRQPRDRAPRRGRRAHRRDQALRVRRSVPARPARDADELDRARGAGHPVRLPARRLRGVPHRAADPVRTVLMLDMSRSMIYRGCFLAAKKVALALQRADPRPVSRATACTSCGFSLYARQFKPRAAAALPWSEWATAPTCSMASCSRASSWPATRAATSRS